MPYSLDIAGEALELHPDCVVYWADRDSLLLSDLHIGKAGHFRRSGIPLPENVIAGNLKKLRKILNHYTPQTVYFLGDLFHSKYNPDWEAFGQFISHYTEIKFVLIMGNHDIMSEYQYQKFNIELVEEQLELGPFVLSHEPLEKLDGTKINIYGHIHPGIRLKGHGRQSLRLACFFWRANHFILPAFGAFTGTHTLQAKKGDQVFVIAEGEVIAFIEPA